MNAKERHVRGIFIGAIILLILACNVPINPTATPLGISDNIPATQVPDIITARSSFTAQNTTTENTKANHLP